MVRKVRGSSARSRHIIPDIAELAAFDPFEYV